MMRKGIVLGFVIVVVLSVAAVMFVAYGTSDGSTSCVQETAFQSLTNNSENSHKPALYLANDGTIKYFYDDFSEYKNSQKILDEFEDPGSWLVNNEKGKLYLVDEFYGGNGSLAYDLGTLQPSISLSKNFSSLQDLTRWEKSGYITMWFKIGDPKGIDSVGINLVDEKGDVRTYLPLPNVHVKKTTFSDQKDIPDLVYPEGDPLTERWTDYQIENGWNYLLWRADNFTDTGHVDMTQIKQVILQIKLNQNVTNQQIVFNDLRIQDGLQHSSNPTHGVWYPPHGRPQYGVYDIDETGNGTHELRLLNVRNTQYLSNGDHGRMITNASVPMDFALKVKFTLIQLQAPETDIKIPRPFSMLVPKIPLDAGLRNNTYFRVTYDFEPDWDPGHDWFGAYLSLEYNKLGLVSVWPIQRNVLQDQEPEAGLKEATTDFTAQNNVKYEMDMIVKNQTTSATIYEVDGTCMNKKSEITYTFNHPRHNDVRYPLAIESTGNLRSIIHEVEIVSLENKTFSIP